MSITDSTSTNRTQESKDARSREEEIFEGLKDAVDKAAKKLSVPVNIDFDERGSRPRFSITLLGDDGEPGIKTLRRYQ